MLGRWPIVFKVPVLIKPLDSLDRHSRHLPPVLPERPTIPYDSTEVGRRDLSIRPLAHKGLAHKGSHLSPFFATSAALLSSRKTLTIDSFTHPAAADPTSCPNSPGFRPDAATPASPGTPSQHTSSYKTPRLIS